MKNHSMGRRRFLSCLGGATGVVLAAGPSSATQTPGAPESTDVFVSGADGINTYRIPAMLRSPNSALLVFCEARKESIKDASPTALVLRRSLDNGRTWLPTQTLVSGEGNDAIMNPCPVVDRSSGAILLFCNNANKLAKGHHRHLLLTSTDDGESWSEPVDPSQGIAGYDDTLVPGPGVGIQMTSGRLVIPGCTGMFDSETRTGLRSRVVYSDDHGKRWTFGERISAFTNECQAVELKDGRLMLNMRDNTGKSCRAVALSEDGGETWGRLYWDKALNECPCQASLIRYSSAKEDVKDRLLFANPDVAGERYGVVKRTRMTVKMSYDEGKTWPVKKLIHPGPSSYSSLVRLSDGDIGIVFEGGQEHRREWIRFVRFSLAWLTDGTDRL
jgi:sialidase-1